MHSKDDIFYSFSQKCGEIIGLTPKAPLFKKIITGYVAYSLLWVYIGMALYNLKFVEDGDVYKLVAVIESAISFTGLFIRKAILLVHGKLMDEIMEERKSFFWEYDKCGTEMGNRFRKNMRFFVNLNKFYIAASSVSIALMCLGTFLNEDQDLPLECWIPGNNRILKNIIYASEIYFTFEVEILFGAFDGFFLLICTDINAQFELMTETMKSIDFEASSSENGKEECLNTIKNCVIHHNKLLVVYQKLNTMFGVYFAFEYALALIGAVPQFYILGDYRTSQPEQMIKSVNYLFALFFQLLVFYLPVCLLSDKAEEFSQGLYLSYWYKTPDASLRNDILFMIVRAQQPLKLTCWGGMFQVDRNQIIQIYRTAFSFSTLLLQLKNL